MKPYPDGPGFVAGSDTSKAAARSVEPHVGPMCARALELFEAAPDGLTVDEIEIVTGWLHQSAGARVRELVLAGRVADSGARRPTRSGRDAVVWRLRPYLVPPPEDAAMAVDLSDLSTARQGDDGVRRDRWGRYLVVPPEGGAPVPYRRTTTVVKALDAEGALVPWAQSRAMLGLANDAAVARRWRKLVKETGDPWYAGKEPKAAARALVAEAAHAGGDGTARDRGTWLHGCAERWVLGLEQLPTFTADDQAWLEGFVGALADAGVQIARHPEWVEAIVVHDELRVAGKADYLRVLVPGYGLPLVGDLKTGTTLEYAINGYAMQLAIYASADSRYEQGEAADGSGDRRLPMPQVDQDHGLVIHAPSDGGPVTFWIVDLVAGRVAFDLALAVEGWRGAAVAHVLGAPEGALLEQLQASLDAVVVTEAEAPPDACTCSSFLTQSRTCPTHGHNAPELFEPQGEPYNNRPALRAWLQARIDVLGAHPDARLELARQWPEGVPPLRASEDHTDRHLELIEAVLGNVERIHGIPFEATPRPEPKGTP